MSEYMYSFRDPIHGFIPFNQLEWDIINSSTFQRLRRIRQLAWTDYVYPGAMHTRFEHSMGVCHVASRLYDAIVSNDRDILRSDYQFNEGGILRQRQIIRLAALLHDLGHGPFSHAAEEVFPYKSPDKKYIHEEYSGALCKYLLKDIIENHPLNKSNFSIKVDEINDIFDPNSKIKASIVWKEIISGQMDADRMDYLLRDSYHSGVSYGKYDLDRLINTVCLNEDTEVGGHLIGVDESGIHAVEGLLIARYMMFTQVYFHKTRVIYDYHYEEALKDILKPFGGFFPTPKESDVQEYFTWDDWRILSELRVGHGGEHGRRLMERDHFRLIFSTSEVPNGDELQRFDELMGKLDQSKIVSKEARKSWYKFQREEIRVRSGSSGHAASRPLAAISPIVNGLVTVNQRRIYAPKDYRATALAIIGS